MADQQTFPYPVFYGMTQIFRVMHINVGTYHIEQKSANATETEPERWQCLAISNHFDAEEALGVMHEAQMVYAMKMRSRRAQIKGMSNGLNA